MTIGSGAVVLATDIAAIKANADSSVASIASLFSGAHTWSAVQTFSAGVTTNTVQSVTSSNAVLFKNGVGGNILLRVGGTAGTIEADTNIVLPGGAWGSGALLNGVAPIFQNATFTGSTTNGAAAFGAFLQQSDNSSVPVGVGFLEHLSLVGSGVIGGRTAGQFNLDINATTGNASGRQYVGLGSKANLFATDGGAGGIYSSVFGANPVATIGPGVIANQCVGAEINTQIQAGAVVGDRIGLQIVDVTGTTYGVQSTRDDVALSLNNQYAPSSTLGFKVGFSFGRSGGNFPVATNGTLISGQGNQGAAWTVANGVDWSLGTATASWLNLGGVFRINGTGAPGFNGHAPPAQPPAPVTLADVIAVIRGCGLSA